MNGIIFIPRGAVIPLVAAVIGAPMVAAGLAAIICRCLRHASAAARHWVWWLALAMMATCFVVAVFQWSVAVPIHPPAGTKLIGRIPQVTVAQSAVVEGVRLAAIALFAGIWEFGVLALLLRSAAGILRLRAIIRRSQSLSASVLETLRTEQRGVRHLVSAEISMPMAAGILRPVILLPESALNWPSHLLRAALVHEYAHVARGDLAMLAFARFVTFFHWMNPVSWYALRRMQAEAEMAADDCVVISDREPVAYAEGLVELIRGSRRSAAFRLPAMGMLRGGGSIQARVARILDGKCRRLPPRALLRWVMMAVVVGLTAGLIGIRFVVASPIPTGAQAMRAESDVPAAFNSAPFTLDAPYPAPANETVWLRAQRLIWYAEGFFLVSAHEPGTDGVRIDLPVGSVLVETRVVSSRGRALDYRSWKGDFPGPGYREQRSLPVGRLFEPVPVGTGRWTN